MIPLIKGIKTLILYSSNDTKIFRALVPKMRSFVSIEAKSIDESECKTTHFFYLILSKDFQKNMEKLNLSTIANPVKTDGRNLIENSHELNFIGDDTKNELNLESSFSGEFEFLFLIRMFFVYN